MRGPEWRRYMESLVESVRAPLCCFAPHRSQELGEIAERAKTAKNARERKKVEKDLDSLVERPIDLRRAADWRGFMGSLVEGISAHLCASAPRKAQRALDEMLARVGSARNARERTKVGEDLEALVESAPHFRAAHKRLIGETLSRALKEAQRIVPLLLEQIRRAEQQEGHNS